MTAPPGATATLTRTTTPVHDQGDDPFQDAVRRADYGLLQSAVAAMTKRDAVEHLAALFPRLTPRWFSRNFAELMALDPDAFQAALHADPTGNAAARNVDNERNAA